MQVTVNRYSASHQQQNGQEDRAAGDDHVSSPWKVAYLLQSATRGWQRHKAPHLVSLEASNDKNITNHLVVINADTSRLQERVDLGSTGVLQVAFVADENGQSMVRFALPGQPVRKFALIADSGRSVSELCHALTRQGLRVRGMEDLPEAVFLKGSDQRTVQALEANIPNLSRPEVQAYIVRLLFQDSFHRFVSDLSEMFSHVQSHFPLPPPAAPASTARLDSSAVPSDPIQPSSPVASTPRDAASSTAPVGGDVTNLPIDVCSAVSPIGGWSRDDQGSRQEGRSANGGDYFCEQVGDGNRGSNADGNSDDDTLVNGVVRNDAKIWGSVENGGGIVSLAKKGGASWNERGKGGRGRGRGVEEARGRGRGAGRIRGRGRGGRQGRGAGRAQGRGGGRGGRTSSKKCENGGWRVQGSGENTSGQHGERGLGLSTKDTGAAKDTPHKKRLAATGSASDTEASSSQGVKSKHSRTHYHENNARPPESGQNEDPPRLFSGEGRWAPLTSKAAAMRPPSTLPTPRPKPPQVMPSHSQPQVMEGGRHMAGSSTGGNSGRRSTFYEISRQGGKGRQSEGRVSSSGEKTPSRYVRDEKATTTVLRASRMRAEESVSVKAEPRKSGTTREKSTGGRGGGSSRGRRPTGRGGTGNTQKIKQKSATFVTAAGVDAIVATATNITSGKGMKGFGNTVCRGGGSGTGSGKPWKIGMPVPVAPPTPSGRAAGLSVMLKNIWSKVNKHRSSWVCWAVDLTATPDYLKAVKNPIDLVGIFQRLEAPTVHYTTKTMLFDDLVLMCQNSLLYNDDGSEYYRATEDLLQYIKLLIVKL